MKVTGLRSARWLRAAFAPALCAAALLAACEARLETSAGGQASPVLDLAATATPGGGAGEQQEPAGAVAYPPLPPGLPAATVVEVVDGDTVDVELDGARERLRLIGLDTPEAVDPRQPVMCYGREASARAKELLLGQTVLLEEDRSQDSRDRYGRLLRYVWLPDGRLFNMQMVAEGYAFEYTYDEAYSYRDAFLGAQEAARSAGLGLWAADTCGGQSIPAGDAPRETATAAPPAAGDCAALPAPPDGATAPESPLRIVGLDKAAETVSVENVSGAAVDLAGWSLCSLRGSQSHPLGGTIAAGEARQFANEGGNIWANDDRDDAALYDPSGQLISLWADR